MSQKRDAVFPLVMSAITVIGFFSALIDSTIGWETLAQTVMIRAIQ